MNLYKSYIKEHPGIFMLTVAVWISGIMAGIYFAFSAKAPVIRDTDTYIQSIVSSKTAYLTVLKNGIVTDLRYTLFLCLSASFLIFMPFTMFLIAFKGLSAGYTSSFIIRLYGLKGVGATLTSVILPLCLTLPILIIMYIMSLDFPLKTFRLRRDISSFERGKMYFSYISKIFILFLALILITALEALFTPRFFNVLLN